MYFCISLCDYFCTILHGYKYVYRYRMDTDRYTDTDTWPYGKMARIDYMIKGDRYFTGQWIDCSLLSLSSSPVFLCISNSPSSVLSLSISLLSLQLCRRTQPAAAGADGGRAPLQARSRARGGRGGAARSGAARGWATSPTRAPPPGSGGAAGLGAGYPTGSAAPPPCRHSRRPSPGRCSPARLPSPRRCSLASPPSPDRSSLAPGRRCRYMRGN